ncbi:MAG: PorT family protein [Melioribacteraceae bacterium]|nr:PorT family protein [Melioribacteraceae bacterium]
MKKTIFVILILFIGSSLTYSQVLPKFGLKAGLNIANHTWDYKGLFLGGIDWDYNYGLTIRAFSEFGFGDHFALQGELGYSRKGNKKDIPLTTSDYPDGNGQYISIENNIDYISVVALAKLSLFKGPISPYIIGGPQMNFFVGNNGSDWFKDIYEDFNSGVLGISIGAGVEFNISPVNVFVEYRYERDLADSYPQDILEIYNFSHAIMFGIVLF